MYVHDNNNERRGPEFEREIENTQKSLVREKGRVM